MAVKPSINSEICQNMVARYLRGLTIRRAMPTQIGDAWIVYFNELVGKEAKRHQPRQAIVYAVGNFVCMDYGSATIQARAATAYDLVEPADFGEVIADRGDLRITVASKNIAGMSLYDVEFLDDSDRWILIPGCHSIDIVNANRIFYAPKA